MKDSLKFEDIILFKTISGLDDSVTIGSYIGGKRGLQEKSDSEYTFTVTVISYTGKEIIFQLEYDDVEKVSTIS